MPTGARTRKSVLGNRYSEIGAWEELQECPQHGGTYLVGYANVYKSKDNEFGQAFEKRYGLVEEGNGCLELCQEFKADRVDADQ
ncbi:hypothetical protein [Planctomycetes bacterium CA13]